MLIGITGKKRSGKDTAGFYLRDTYGFTKARPLAIFKDSFKEWFGWDERHMEGDLKEVVDPLFGFSPRQLMQVFGTELMKYDLGNHIPGFAHVCGEDIWIRSFVRWYDQQPRGNYVLTDLRFVNESQRIPFDIIIRLKSDRSPEDTHASEQEIDRISADYEIVNNGYGTQEALFKELDRIIDEVGIW
jgi:hypothetical protein